MKFQVTHKTIYQYGGVVNLCFNEARMIPRNLPNQDCLKYELSVEPHPLDYDERIDFFGNKTAYFSIQEPHKELKVITKSEVEIRPYQLVNLNGSPTCSEIRKLFATSKDAAIIDAKQYVFASPLINPFHEIREYAEISFWDDRPILEAAFELTQRIFKDFKFVPGFTSITTPLHEVAKHKKGVCQDYAQFAIACVRSMGLAARYVSGYIETLPPEGEEKLEGVDASHAWLSVFSPGFGWLDFDPTNNQIPKEQHVTVAYGRDYLDITPFKGVIYSSGKHKMKVEVDMKRI
ncbi:MAG: transglutaminase family protein [Flammeovirgaceae bacterium]|nr:transglutaminase family protein [Flammeovirgaceae bacterium]